MHFGLTRSVPPHSFMEGRVIFQRFVWQALNPECLIIYHKAGEMFQTGSGNGLKMFRDLQIDLSVNTSMSGQRLHTIILFPCLTLASPMKLNVQDRRYSYTKQDENSLRILTLMHLRDSLRT